VGEFKNRIRVLAIAEAANPEWTSVPLVGWSLANALRKVADVRLVTQIRNRFAILSAGLKENEDFTSIDSEAVMKPIWRLSTLLRGGTGKGWTTVMAANLLGYYYFEYLVWRMFKKSISNGDFDVVHRITPLSPTMPSLMAKKCKSANVPFVLGPLNGGVPWPKGFDDARRKEKEWLSYIRGVYKFMPGYRSTLRSSAALLIGSRGTFVQIPEKYYSKCVYLPENAVDPNNFSETIKVKSKHQLRACFVGRLVPYKGPDMLIEAALPLLHSNRIKLDIIGDGPMMPVIQKMVREQRIDNQVILHGWIEHSKLQKQMCKAQIFAFPSIREFGGGVVLEAMALGLVPVVVDYAGPGELVTENTGFKVPLGSRGDIIISFRSILEKISSNLNILNDISKLAVSRVNEFFTWDVKAKQVAKVYEWALNKKLDKPNFF